MALTIGQMQELMGSKHKPVKTNALVRLSAPNGGSVLERQQVKPSQFGAYVGKQGTKRRSRKGLVRTMPNGWVKYNDVTDIEVVAYKA